MSSFLAVCLLLIGHLFRSSATSLKTIKLASVELSQNQSLTASPIESSVTTLDSNITKLANLVGYVINVGYTDSSCSTFSSVRILKLNECYRYSTSGFRYVTATSALVTYSVFEDAQCKLAYAFEGAKISKSYTSKVCSESRMISISETSDFTPTVAVGFER